MPNPFFTWDDLYTIYNKIGQGVFLFFLFAAALALFIILQKKNDGRVMTRNRTLSNRIQSLSRRNSLGRPLFIAYDGAWTRGQTGTYNKSGAATRGPYDKVDVLVISFSDLQYYGSGTTMLIGGINGPPQQARDASLLFSRQRLASHTLSSNPPLSTLLSDPYASQAEFITYLNACKAANPTLQIQLGLGGAAASDVNSAKVFADITSQNIKDIFASYPQFDGIHLDIENTSIDPKVFLSQCVMMGNSLPATKHLTLSIEILQACSPPNFAQYAELWKNKPAELFDFVSVQFYNYGYPTDPTAEPSPNNPSGGDFPALLKLGFLPHQILMGINPGPDEIKNGGGPWIANIANTTAVLNYIKNNNFGGVALWSIQRDSATGNNGDVSTIPATNLTFDFQRYPQDGKSPEIGWNAPWPAAYVNVAPDPATFSDGAFGLLIVNTFNIA